MKMHLQILPLSFLMLFVFSVAATDCQRECGGTSVPYPFGLGNSSDCYKHYTYKLICGETFNPPRLHLGCSLSIFNISIEEGIAFVNILLAFSCYDKVPNKMDQSNTLGYSPFTMKTVTKVLIAMGASDFVADVILSLVWWYKKKIQVKNHVRNGELLFILLLPIPIVKATTFSYPSFESIPKNMILQGNASSSSGMIELTSNRHGIDFGESAGRALYADPIHLWDSTTGKEADFSTHFSFKITPTPDTYGADGITFFLAPNGTIIPENSQGGCFGLISKCWESNSSEPLVAIEFDTFRNAWDLVYTDDHVGIDINSVNSTALWEYNFLYPNTTYVWVNYNSSTQYLSVSLSYDENYVLSAVSNLSLVIDLKSILPEWVNVGFSSTTGNSFELHTLLSWQFNSTEFPPSTSEREIPPIPLSDKISPPEIGTASSVP